MDSASLIWHGDLCLHMDTWYVIFIMLVIVAESYCVHSKFEILLLRYLQGYTTWPGIPKLEHLSSLLLKYLSSLWYSAHWGPWWWKKTQKRLKDNLCKEAEGGEYPVYIKDDLTKHRAKLAFLARQSKNDWHIMDTWTADSKVMINGNYGRISTISTEYDLRK